MSKMNNNQQREPDSGERGLVLSGITGIICNLILCALKFTVGILSGSVSVCADGFNNLSDSATNIVTIIGAKLSRKPVDREHPFGHGRIEYIAALVVAFSIFTVSFELLKSSVEKIINPQSLSFNPVFIIILSASICIKLWMALFNHRLYKKSGSVGLKAVRQDSLNDCIATLATVAALAASEFLSLNRIDGIVGIFVAVFVFWSGISILRDILNPLLGQAPSRETTYKLEELILDNDNVLGVHDIIVHSYGAGHTIASAHAEIADNLGLITAHRLVDSIERKIKDELNISITIHIDPVALGDSQTKRYKDIAEKVITGYNSAYSFHDLRLYDSSDGIKLSFDVVVPFEEKDAEKAKEDISRLFKNSTGIEPDITVEYPLT